MPPRTPKYRKIVESLQEQIAAGKYAENARLPSELELARLFKVSRPTVGRALRELQERDLLSRRVGSGTYLRPGRSTSLVLSLLVPGLGNTEILDPICNEITRFGQANDFSVLWGDASAPVSTAEDAERLCRQYIDRKVSGVFFAPLESIPDCERTNLRIVSALRKAQIEVVLLDRDVLEFPGRSEFDLVGIDNFQAGMILTQHLIGLGNKGFLFVARPNYPATTDLRLAGCREAADRAGFPHPRTGFGDPTNIAFVRELLRREMPDVVICSNDRTAALLIQTLANLGVKMPQDLGVVGFDDVRYATLLSVPLTTIRQPCREIGQTAVRIMRERINDRSLPPRQVLLPIKLIVRRSCGAEAV